MPVKYHVLQRRNPLKPEDPKRFYAAFKSNGELTLKRLAERIGQISTVSRTDTYAVLTALVEVIPAELADGQTIRLGDLGSLSVNISSNPSDTAEEVSASNIRSSKVVFRPGKELRATLKTLSFQKDGD